MVEFHTARAFAREEPRVELIETMLKSLLDVVDLEYQGQPVKVDGFRLRNLEDWRTIDQESPSENLGSLSTVCNCNCAFCYEDGNPVGLFDMQPKFVSVQEGATRLRYLRDGRGLLRESKAFFEPLANPNVFTLLQLVRETDPDHVIDMTTNGSLFTPEGVARLAELGPVFVNLSLISADEPMRRQIMSDRRAPAAIEAIELLNAHRVPFMGTMVPLPEQGLDDVTQTIEYLDAHEARIIRISLPGLSRYHRNYRPGVLEDWVPRLTEHVLTLRDRFRTPLLVSPYSTLAASLEATLAGVVAGSPAASAGIKLGDVLVRVDGTQVVSRSHAISLLQKAHAGGSVEVEIRSNGSSAVHRLTEPDIDADAYPYKPRGYKPFDFRGFHFGLCLPASFHLGYLRQMHEAIESRQAQRTLVISSRYFGDLVRDLFGRISLPEGSTFDVLIPGNRFFGGTVDVGDLWVLEDIVAAVQQHLESNPAPDLIIIPSSFLSRWGKDLLGVHYREAEAVLGIEIAIVSCERIVL